MQKWVGYGLLTVAVFLGCLVQDAQAKTGVNAEDIGAFSVFTDQTGAPRNATTITAAVTKCETAGQKAQIYLWPGAQWVLNADVTFPTCTLWVPPGATIALNGHMLTLNTCPRIEPPGATWYTGSGSVVVNGCPPPVAGYVTLAGAEVLTNKEVVPRVVILTDAATVTPNIDTTDSAVLNTLSQTTTIANPIGTPTDRQEFHLSVRSLLPQLLAWGSSYSTDSGLMLPVVTAGGGLVDEMTFRYHAVLTKYVLVAWNRTEATRYQMAFPPSIKDGGLHPVGGSLTSAAFATRGFTSDGLFVSQPAAAITYGNNATYCWTILDSGTIGNLLTFTRAGSTHYLIDCAAGTTQPPLPSTSTWLMRVTTAGGAITAVQNLAASRSPVSASLSLINVMDYGADPDDPGDDTAAILTAINAISGVSFSATRGSGCLYFPLPMTDTGFYKISSTIDLSNKWSFCLTTPAQLTRGQSDDDATRRALFKWYGPPDTDVIVLNNQIGGRLEGISVDCRDIAGTVGIAYGPRQTAASVVKFVQAKGIEVSHCDIGIRHGDYSANGPDIASNTFDTLYAHDNLTAGFAQYTGNGLVDGRNWTMEHNGYAPTVATHGGEAALLQQGANVYASGGSVLLTKYVGTGGLDSVDPAVDGDIVVDSAGLTIIDAWIESHTKAVVCRGTPDRTSEITGLLHYNALMTEVLVPTSLVWQCAPPLIISGKVFGNVEIQAGTNTRVMDKGLQFIDSAQQHGRVPTFTGSALGAPFYTHAYGGFPSGAQRARLSLGLPPRTDLGTALPPAIEQTGRELEVLDTFCTQDINGESCNTLAVQRGGTGGVGAFHWLGNGYWQGGAIKSHKAGKMSWFTWSGGDPALGQPNIRLLTDEAASAGLTKFTPGTTVFSVTYRGTGTGTVPVLGIGDQSQGWANAPPTVGTWSVGNIFLNLNPASGQPFGWMCSVAGTPGTWVPLANIP